MNSTSAYDQTKSRRDTLSALRNEARSADVKDDARFQMMIGACRYVLEMSDQEIGDALHVSRPTVSRWINAKNIPHPVMRKPIFAWIGSQAARKLRILEDDEGRSLGGSTETVYNGAMVARARKK